jgi:hypothetical protein
VTVDIRRHPTRMGAFLEALPIKLFATITAPRSCSREAWDGNTKDWLNQVERAHRCPIGYIKSLERYPARHLHIALVAALPLSASICEDLWRSILRTNSRSAARIEPFRPGAGGMAYLLKGLGSNHEEVELSPNIDYFDPHGWRPGDATTSRERRSAGRAINPRRWKLKQMDCQDTLRIRSEVQILD